MWTTLLWTSSIVQVYDFLTFDVLHKKWHNDVAHGVAACLPPETNVS